MRSGPHPPKKRGGCGIFPCSRGYHVRIAHGKELGARQMQSVGALVFVRRMVSSEKGVAPRQLLTGPGAPVLGEAR